MQKPRPSPTRRTCARFSLRKVGECRTARNDRRAKSSGPIAGLPEAADLGKWSPRPARARPKLGTSPLRSDALLRLQPPVASRRQTSPTGHAQAHTPSENETHVRGSSGSGECLLRPSWPSVPPVRLVPSTLTRRFTPRNSCHSSATRLTCEALALWRLVTRSSHAGRAWQTVLERVESVSAPGAASGGNGRSAGAKRLR